MGIILEASHLTYGYDESSHAIEDLSIAFEEGKTTAILGANGAGKSTLFLHLNGILQPEQGEVRFRGQPISYKKKQACGNCVQGGYRLSGPGRPAVFGFGISGHFFRSSQHGLARGGGAPSCGNGHGTGGDHIPERPSYSRPELRTEKAGGICRHYGHAAGSHYSGRAHGRTGPCGHQ